MKKRIFILLIVVPLMLIIAASCAPDAIDISQCATAEPAGFWLGLWHGWISGVVFFVSLFNDNVAVYEVNNTGGWYDFGFLLGIGSLIGTGARKA